MTLEEQLDRVQMAISRIEEGGQEIDIEVGDNRSRTVRGRLQDLYNREAKLLRAIARQNGGGIIYAIPR